MTAPKKSGRRRFRWLFPTLLILAWMIFSGAGSSYTTRLGEVVKNDNAAFLPTDAEATQVANALPGFVGSEQIPAVVIYVRDGGVTNADKTTVAGDITFYQSVTGVDGQVLGPIPSEDGKALQVIVPLAGTGDATLLPLAVNDIRARAQSHAGLTAHVTGPGGMAGDLGDIFSGADLKLLIVGVIVVFFILVVVYRSIILPIVVLTAANLAQVVASAVVYLLANEEVIKLNGQSQGALVIICIGTATDYALLLVGRYREELRDRESKYEAMRNALRQSAPTILASGFTVILAMSFLLLSKLGSNRGFGPVFMLGVAASMLTTLTFLSAILVLLGRAAFWPVRPKFGSEHALEHGIWGRAANLISRRARLVWVGTAAVLVALAAFLPTFKAVSVPITESLLTKPDSVVGLDVLALHYPAGSGAPALVLAPAAAQAALAKAIQGVAGVDNVVPFSEAPLGTPNPPPKVVNGQVLLQATLADASDSAAAEQTVLRLRDTVHATNPDARVGGMTAIAIDSANAGRADLKLIVPIVLLVVFLLLVLLLRALVGPFLLITTVVLSVLATMGLAAIAFNEIFKFPGADPSLPLFCIVFLIAVGVDYNIFLMARVREESARLLDTRKGVLRGLTTTGGVITSAGIVLAATFSLFGLVPFLPLVEIAFIVVAGILIDTFIVRALLVPALSYDVGRNIWWPSSLRRRATGSQPGAVKASELARTR